MQEISTGYKPRDLQQELHIAMAVYRFVVLNLHRRFGKTVFAVNEEDDTLLNCPHHQPQGVYVAPTYGQAKRVAWDYFKLFTKMIPGVEYKEGDLLLIIPRPHMNDSVKVWLIGAENPDSIRGMYLDFAVLDEYADMNPIIWSQVIRPALSDRKGKAIFIGTPKGENHFFDIYNAANDPKLKDWFARTITVEESGYVDKDELESARMTMTEDEYQQEFMCSFTAALTGAYYAKYLQIAEEQGRICDIPHNPRLPVATFWDLGIADSMAIWFIQKVGQWYNVIDYYEDTGKGIEHYIKYLNGTDYIYAKHHLPHDVKKRQLLTGTTRMESFEDLGLRPIIAVPRTKAKMDTINSVRMVLPMCRFDKTRCASGLAALKNYQREWDGKLKRFKDTPKHDWTSHGSDAFGTFGQGYTDSSFLPNYSMEEMNIPMVAEMEYDEFE